MKRLGLAVGGRRPVIPSIQSLAASGSNSGGYHIIPSSVTRYTRRHASNKSQESRIEEDHTDSDLFREVLSANVTKRDTKGYTSRYKDQQNQTVSAKDRQERQDFWRLHRSGVNLGHLYSPTKAIKESPVFAQKHLPEHQNADRTDPIHVAIVKIRSPQELDDEALGGVGLTLSQLVRLGLNSAVVIDCDQEDTPEKPETLTQQWRDKVLDQAQRLADRINKHPRGNAQVIDQAMRISPEQEHVPCRTKIRGGVEVNNQEMIYSALRSGSIPIIPPVAYTQDVPIAQKVHADDVMLALTRQFAGIKPRLDPKDAVEAITNHDNDSLEPTSLDRVIILDPLGGIPANNRTDNAHVFINLEQEYPEIRRELLDPLGPRTSLSSSRPEPSKQPSVLGSSNPLTKFAEQEVIPSLSDESPQQSLPDAQSSISFRHLKNLDLLQRTLTLLPPSSSALLTSPYYAAASSHSQVSPEVGVATRRQKNPLIHNLLTDKPLISSSLPSSRLTDPASQLPSTFVKRGMPITIVPNPATDPWFPPGPEGTSLTLADPRIDFGRLKDLIEDSFNRPLDVDHYLHRIHHKLAGIIIAGEYEGGAILTWETSPDAPHRPPVPYLDKFAVLTRSQGAGGVADIVFNAMVRSCFPSGVVWRSRQNNPVNKWYFERSRGTWKIPGTQWTMFWTGPGVEFGSAEDGVKGAHGEGVVRTQEEKRQRWDDYVGVCKSITASWKDTKPPD
ncbi:N-acetylglutamate synthase [Aulographum hederae CBS 113979]|uniref:Amino-acid acetyltransferase, mitochondrial n=1 Tax=Aulographum hederae CBS 113979 TaxID=1176131 RepID=A0A6G1H370_9PEZI|nr:N-acetylglutamate synthase [Aulographum hederae CBS 113979]